MVERPILDNAAHPREGALVFALYAEGRTSAVSAPAVHIWARAYRSYVIRIVLRRMTRRIAALFTTQHPERLAG